MLSLDLLRGFFIIVIIIDHLWRWPNLFEIITGRGELWVTAGEGFVIISGLLVGYVRGYKNITLPLKEVAVKVWKRAALLYGWLVGLTLLYVAATWYITFSGSIAWVEIPKGEWGELIRQTVLTDYQHTLIHFLYFYALLLAVTPIMLYFLRKGQAYVVIVLTIIGYIVGRQYNIEWLQWMPMFFPPAIIGFYLPSIQKKWSILKPSRRLALTSVLYLSVISTILLSVLCTFIAPTDQVSHYLNQLFSKEFSFPAARVPIALLWFVGFAMFFHHFRAFINKWLGWLLIPFGLRSLTAYIVHGSVIFLIAYFMPASENVWYNTIIGVIAVLGTWILVKNPYVQKVIPQ